MKETAFKLPAYSALASSFLLLANRTEAQMVLVDLDPDLTVEVGSNESEIQQLNLDLDDDGQTDFLAQVRFVYSCGPCPNTSSAFFFAARDNEIGGKSILYDIECSTYTTYIKTAVYKMVQEVGEGVSIPGSASTFNRRKGMIYYNEGGVGYCYFSPFGDMNRVSTYLPISLDLDGNKHYGWIRFRSERVSESGEIVKRVYIEEYAYNSIPDEAVITADIPSSLESNYLLVQPVVYTAGEAIHIVAPEPVANENEVAVYDLNGALVYRGNDQVSYKVPLLQGVYLIHFKAGGSTWSGKTLLVF